jgi:mono/diheme cytochrome c family protein
MAHNLGRRTTLGVALVILAGVAADINAQPTTGQGQSSGMMGGGSGMMSGGLGVAGGSSMMGGGSGMMGAHLFENHCAVCHRSDGSGGIRLGALTSPDLRAPALEQTYHKSDALLRRAILDGKNEEGAPLDPVMPRWRGRLSRQEVDSIIAFLKALHQ